MQGMSLCTETHATILICEDDPVVSELLIDELTADGYAASSCGTVAEAREGLIGTYPDALVVDVGLPDGSGLELVREIRSAAWSGIDPALPVLTLSGRCSESDRVRAFEFGTDDFISKPFGYRELRGFVFS